MSLAVIAAGFRKVQERVAEIATRLCGHDERLAKLEQSLQQLIPDPQAVPVVPGSPIHELSETFVARITGVDPENENVYLAQRQRPTGLGTWEDDSDDATPVRVSTLPKMADGSDPEYSKPDTDQLVHVRWEGRDEASGEDFHTVAPSAAGVKAFRVYSVQNDYLTCREIKADGTVDSVDVYVAKPWELRRTTYDGTTISYASGDTFSYAYTNIDARTVTKVSNGSTEPQIVIPKYRPKYGTGWAGSVITATKGTSTPVTATIEGKAVVLTMEDDNRAGRAWAESAT